MKFLLFIPCTFLISVFILGFCDVAAQSIDFYGDPTLSYYLQIGEEFISSLFYTFHVALSSSIAATLIGICLGILLFGSRPVFEKLLMLPIVVPHFVAALLMFNLLSNSGILARIFGDLPTMVFDKYAIGAIIAYIWKGFPFVALLVIASLRRFDFQLFDASRSLGASSLRASFDIILPHVSRSVITGFILLFVFAMGAFEIPFLLGASSPRVLPVMAYSYYTGADENLHRISMAICVLLSIFSLILILPMLRNEENS